MNLDFDPIFTPDSLKLKVYTEFSLISMIESRGKGIILPSKETYKPGKPLFLRKLPLIVSQRPRLASTPLKTSHFL